jgi:hypothetical protein
VWGASDTALTFLDNFRLADDPTRTQSDTARGSSREHPAQFTSKAMTYFTFSMSPGFQLLLSAASVGP